MPRHRLLLAGVPPAALIAAGPAGAQCPGNDGALPGSPAAVHTVSAGGQTIRVDDRDFLDLDDDGDAGGLWIYLEPNGAPGLQRGGYGALVTHHDDCRQSTNPDTIIV